MLSHINDTRPKPIFPGRLRSKEEYIDYCLRITDDLLYRYGSMDEIARLEEEINAYPNLEYLKPPKGVYVLKDGDSERRTKAAECILSGRFFSEHAVAGEATRLGLGTKFLLNIGRDFTFEMIAELMSREKGLRVTPEEVEEEAGCRPEDLKPISLGDRHMLQFARDIRRLAEEYGCNPEDVLAKQKMLLILNQKSADEIIEGFIEKGFYGFQQENVLFMIQDSFHGISEKNGCAIYDRTTPQRLHNHGQIVIQQTMDDQVFRVMRNHERQYLTAGVFADILSSMDNKVTYSIEDLGFLTQSIDLDAIGFALEEGGKGTRMVMEIVANDPDNPQKGGMAAFDPILDRNVMIEGFQLKGLLNKDIVFLNKNFNHYPNPFKSWCEIAKNGLNMPLSMKKRSLYFQAVQGDINFLVDTAFFQREGRRVIKALKSAVNLPLAVEEMFAQDGHPS